MTAKLIDMHRHLDLGEGVPRREEPAPPKNKEEQKPYDVKLHRTGAAVLLEHPCIVNQHEKFPETVVLGTPQPSVYNLSVPEDTDAFSVLWGRVHNPDGPTAQILERESNFYRGAYYVRVLWQPVLYKQLISPKESDYVDDKASV